MALPHHREQARPQLKKKSVDGKQNVVAEASAAKPSSPYAPGSLTAMLNSAAAAGVCTSPGAVLAGFKRKGLTPNTGKCKKQLAEHLATEADGLEKLRALFDKAPEKQHTKWQCTEGSCTNSSKNSVAIETLVEEPENRNSTSFGKWFSATADSSSSQNNRRLRVFLLFPCAFLAGSLQSITQRMGACKPSAVAASTVAPSKKRKMRSSKAAGTAEVSSGSESDGTVEEVLAQGGQKEAQETREDKQRRTLFVGNLPVRDAFKPIELYRHLGLQRAQVESMRLRSVPVAVGFQRCRRAAIARKKFSSCDVQNAYLVLKDRGLVEDVIQRKVDLFKGRELRLDGASRSEFSLFDRKRSVFVGGVPREAAETDLKEALAFFGPVQSQTNTTSETCIACKSIVLWLYIHSDVTTQVLFICGCGKVDRFPFACICALHF
ncbi:uncharacterized protein LOC34620466 [Cyclospora cayetanensis]|uniref:Uncharacterized protein LOC34620466 n=1 Tax=Cyclospora cayetanensis TaxID=88456 RepID=A0A6P6S0D2_9EIME|nr:uncharacterized protein LOC34620466 [Cyclospora cayetanensis]